MARRGMGAASRGGGAVESGKKNKKVSEPSKSTGKVLMVSKGGDVNQHKRMAMGMKVGGVVKGYNTGGSVSSLYGGLPKQQPVKRKNGGMMGGGMAKKKVKKMRYGGSCD